ncbi:hypothetical protein L6307_01195 [Candidatus Parcubacteria bacterium]|nr:hypothetical protein [Candidatus Parcubacteria bacterium]
MPLFGKKIRITFLFIFLAELFSIFGYLLPCFNNFAFLIIIFLVLFLSLINLEYGIWIIFAELFIGSKGYLFAFEQGEFLISIRIALWLVVMAVWLGKTISNGIKHKKLEIKFFKSCYFYYFIILFLFIAWGIISGVLNHNSFNNIFFDFNGWLYFALIFPVYDIIKNQQSVNYILQIFTASIIWLSAKTLFLLFIFSHNITSITSELYRWVRVTGVGEITQMQGGFYRIFFQSHIFVLIGLFVFILLLTQIVNQKDKYDKKILTSYFLLLASFLSIILISFSRSFWVGLIIGLLFYYFTPHLSSSFVIDKNFSNKKYSNILKKGAGFIILLFYKIGWKKFIITNAILLCAGILSVGLIAAIVKFPYPNPTGGFNTTELLSERAGQISGEAGASSRWALLPELWDKIKQSPILGQGFGATVTYKSSDPRVLESSPTGEYTTYAFEWGWLDIWLKLGLLGLIAYLALLTKIIFDGIFRNKANDNIIYGLTIGLIAISAVSIFSPYMNHPLGIGYLILCAAIINAYGAEEKRIV